MHISLKEYVPSRIAWHSLGVNKCNLNMQLEIFWPLGGSRNMLWTQYWQTIVRNVSIQLPVYPSCWCWAPLASLLSWNFSHLANIKFNIHSSFSSIFGLQQLLRKSCERLHYVRQLAANFVYCLAGSAHYVFRPYLLPAIAENKWVLWAVNRK